MARDMLRHQNMHETFRSPSQSDTVGRTYRFSLRPHVRPTRSCLLTLTLMWVGCDANTIREDDHDGHSECPTGTSLIVPGCATPAPIWEKGCYASCSALGDDAVCGAGYSCQQTWIDPCVPKPGENGSCDACGLRTFLCLPAPAPTAGELTCQAADTLLGSRIYSGSGLPFAQFRRCSADTDCVGWQPVVECAERDARLSQCSAAIAAAEVANAHAWLQQQAEDVCANVQRGCRSSGDCTGGELRCVNASCVYRAPDGGVR
jgi:hypothetical protein